MPGKPAPIKKSPAKMAAEKAAEPEAAAVEAPSAEAPAETTAAAERGAAPPATSVEDSPEGSARAAEPPAECEAAPTATDAAAADAAPAESAPVEEPPRVPTPPPPAARPKIKIPRNLRTCFVKQVGEQINLVIPFLGKPKPVVSWLKDGQPLDPKRVNFRNSDKDSILFIRGAQREDSGVYEMTVKVDSFEDTATITLQIVELPCPPAGVKLVDCWGFNAALEWTAPKDNGNTEITGYIVQKADMKTGDWFTVLEHYHRLTATISDLIMGNSYSFRVFSVNKVGVSEKSAITKDVATIQKTGINYKPPEYQEHDFSEAPKFTTQLNDRAATVGYTTKLLCSVRGCPKPKIEWLKNQMVIGDDPKFRQISNQGICSLEIRKPCCFDGGVYTCRAKNAEGEATISCKLEVKQVFLAEADKEKGK
ncbi:myosin binding protein Ha isoform X3 [Entelurus aequoreus]|uniref:myosin binding protein Ha isoform X3 n=1 Tax=Entelurus aequoreus TaxID=161455 RepID=UPI002B1E3C1A|nr:myosin binding protein Ha isoform X3 [Entelurus aequoreus]